VVTYCDVQDGYPGMGNIDQLPQFVDPEGDYHLTSQSPCIDSGTLEGAPADDMDGQARPNPDSGLVDIGADEFYGPFMIWPQVQYQYQVQQQ